MDAKKKKNRKKKGNQNKTMEDVVSNGDEVVVQEHGYAAVQEQNHNHSQISANNVDAQSIGVSESDVELERHKIYEAKFGILHEEVRRLEDEKNLWLQREAAMEEKIKHIEDGVHSCIRNEAALQNKLNNLQIGNDSLIQKEVILEERVKHIESFQDAWNLEEISFKEMISRLEDVNTGLQVQVKELEESRNSIIQEKQQLVESISTLEMRIQHLEKETLYESSAEKLTKHGEEEILSYQTEAASAPVEDQDTQNAQANELQSALDHSVDVADADASTLEANHVVSPVKHSTPANLVTDQNENIHHSVGNQERFSIRNGVGNFDAVTQLLPGQPYELDEPRRSAEIVQIPLDDTPVRHTQSQAVTENNAAVPLSDAPLIGAPFRLISFMAKYVSGADLVSKNSYIARR